MHYGISKNMANDSGNILSPVFSHEAFELVIVIYGTCRYLL